MAHCSSCGSEAAGRFCAACGAPVPVDSFATRTLADSTPPAATAARTSRVSSSSRARGRFAPGELLGGRYRILAMLGKGGMGEVYRADDLSLDQPVALKFLPEAIAHNENALERFRGEVRIARQVSHPNVCRVYDLGEMEGLYFLSMEYVDGEDLGSLLRRIGRLPGDKALEIARKLCAGLAAAHEKGVLHRDLKPANVMLDARGQVLLTDFGLAGLAGEIEGAEVRNGTPAYMAPEQLSGQEVTVKSDIYALGLVLYEIFTGKLPFESETLTGLMRAQRESTPVSPSTLVGDLDPMVERVILRCLSSKPAMRPSSALAVAAALPGGDPLAAALAAGETPSPEMVAAAGEGEGLSLRIAIPLLLTVLVGIPLGITMRSSALATMAPEFGPEVLAQKSRDIAATLGVDPHPFDESFRYDWDSGLFEWFSTQSTHTNWNQVLAANPQALRFHYRSHTAPLTGLMFHDDLLTPGLNYWDDPPFEESGMVRLKLDARGRLEYFERIPAQRQPPVTNAPPADWKPLFAAAALDPSTFQPAEPQWTSLATSDTRMAWTRNSPRQQRVEAAALRGQPVFFALIEPWTKPDRTPGADNSTAATIIVSVLGGLLVVVLTAAAWLAAGNLRRRRGDGRGAFRLAAFTFCVQMLLWAARAHIGMTLGTFGIFLVALATSVFYGAAMWLLYIALEPYVRRRWPQTLISWSAVLIGRLRDPIVGRDVLIGCTARRAAGGAQRPFRDLAAARRRLAEHGNNTPATWRARFPGDGSARRSPRHTGALFFFFLIFLLRAVLRNQWAAGGAFALILASLSLLDSGHPVFRASINFIVFIGLAFVVLRWGLLALGISLLFLSVSEVPAPQISAWYFSGSACVLIAALALVAWAFHTSIGARKIWNHDFF